MLRSGVGIISTVVDAPKSTKVVEGPLEVLEVLVNTILVVLEEVDEVEG